MDLLGWGRREDWRTEELKRGESRERNGSRDWRGSLKERERCRGHYRVMWAVGVTNWATKLGEEESSGVRGSFLITIRRWKFKSKYSSPCPFLSSSPPHKSQLDPKIKAIQVVLFGPSKPTSSWIRRWECEYRSTYSTKSRSRITLTNQFHYISKSVFPLRTYARVYA